MSVVVCVVFLIALLAVTLFAIDLLLQQWKD